MKYFFLVLVISGLPFMAKSQDSVTVESDDKWDNQLFFSNKAAWSKGNWRYTGEFQIRLFENTKKLNSYLMEGVASYMPNAKWEIIPDLRFTVTSTKDEVRPGLGVIYKQFWGAKFKNQLAHQMKYQADFVIGGKVKTGFRYIIFHNIVLNDKLIMSSAAGAFYRWSNDFTGVQFGRVMTGLGYSFDKQHLLSLSYFVGIENGGEQVSYIGGPLIQLVIRFSDDYKYVPAKYISF
jgi:hypothetical protein